MEFAFSTNAFREHTLEEAIEAIAAAGYDGVELLLDEPHLYPPAADEADYERVQSILAAHDIAISNCNAFMLTALGDFHHPSFVEPDPVDRRQRVEYTRSAVDAAAELGAAHISIEPGGPIPPGTRRETAMERFVSGLERVLERAEAQGVDVLVEPEPDLLIETSSEYLELTDRVDSPRLGCNLDAGHCFCVGEDPATVLADLWAHTQHVHLEDIPADRRHEHTQLGEGAMDIDGFLEALENRGYDGHVTVELYPYEEQPAATAQGAMTYLTERGWV